MFIIHNGSAKGEALDQKFLLKWEQFELQKEIGEGAYANVYLAKASIDGVEKDLAVKELKLQVRKTFVCVSVFPVASALFLL